MHLHAPSIKDGSLVKLIFIHSMSQTQSVSHILGYLSEPQIRPSFPIFLFDHPVYYGPFGPNFGPHYCMICLNLITLYPQFPHIFALSSGSPIQIVTGPIWELPGREGGSQSLPRWFGVLFFRNELAQSARRGEGGGLEKL